jgi:putative hydrolase of the HAD superfamily
MLKGLIFDLGGTLMHFDGKFEEVDRLANEHLVAFLRAHNLATPDDFHARLIEHRKRHWRAAEDTGVEARVGEAIRDTLAEIGHRSLDGLMPRIIQAYFVQHEAHWLAYPDSVETLRVLHARGLRLGVISNADDEHLVYRATERLGFAPFVNPVLSSAADPRWRKPDARIFHLISDAWQIAPNEIAMVGDSPRYDIIGAHNAGMRGILINRADGAPWQKIPDEFANDPLWRADAIVHAVAEIPAVVDRWMID